MALRLNEKGLKNRQIVARIGAALLATLLLAGVVGGLGCDKKKTPGKPDAGSQPLASARVVPAWTKTAWGKADREQAIQAGTDVFLKHQCNRCHTIDKVSASARELDCVSCHNFLKDLKKDDRRYQKMAKKYGDPVIERYQRNIVHLRQVPDLTKLAERVRTDWIRSFLQEPTDLRPVLAESMIRHHLNDQEIKQVVRYFAAVAEAPDPYAVGYKPPTLPTKVDQARLKQGKDLFAKKACGTCHTFGNQATGQTRPALESRAELTKLAINLRFVKERSRPDSLLSWLMDPARMVKGTTMPDLGLTLDEAKLLRDYLFTEDPKLKPLPEKLAPKLPPVLSREVSYEEMKEKVLGRICVHCHMNNYEKDPGPGNLGGLGYSGDGLQMRTYESLVYGAVDHHGKRYSVLQPAKDDALPRILQVMLDRKIEEQRDHIPAWEDHERPHYPANSLGMPLGLPSMSEEEIAIMATWIKQGCKGPTKVTGMKGVDDGYLVPDGPIQKNQGCEWRKPSTNRPAWAVDTTWVEPKFKLPASASASGKTTHNPLK
jgi:cytochrome c2